MRTCATVEPKELIELLAKMFDPNADPGVKKLIHVKIVVNEPESETLALPPADARDHIWVKAKLDCCGFQQIVVIRGFFLHEDEGFVFHAAEDQPIACKKCGLAHSPDSPHIIYSPDAEVIFRARLLYAHPLRVG